MNKTKKALLAAIACTMALSGAVGLAACNTGGDGNETTPHTHTWSKWTVEDANKPTADAKGKATRTCTGAGECDAEDADKEHELPALGDSAYTKSEDTANCAQTGEIVYTYDADGVNVNVYVATGINPEKHSYGDYVKIDPDGHYQVCENSSSHLTEKVAHDNNGTDGVCSVCGYEEIALTLGTEATVSGATASVPKLYTVTLEAGKYELVVGGNAIDTNTNTQIAIGTYADGVFTPVSTDAQRLLELEAGKYYVRAYADVTFKVDTAANHTHAFNTSVWEKDATGHWHPATCIHSDEKGGFAKHVFGEFSEADEDGVKTKSCECGYEEKDYNGTAISGTTSEFADVGTTLNVTETGNYTAIIGAGSYNVPTTQRFNLTNSGSETKKYTVKILTDNTKITLTDNENYKYYDPIEEEGASVSFLLGAGSAVDLAITTNEFSGYEGYAVPVTFRVVVEELPDVGDMLNPAEITQAGEQKLTVEAFQTVYFKVSRLAFDCSGYTLKFGEGVQVMSLGANVSNAGEEVVSGGNITRSEWVDCYISVTSPEAGELVFTLEEYWAPGTKKNPAVAQIGADKTNTAALDFSTREQWFKLETSTAGKYIIKTNSINSNLSIYASVDSYSPVSTAEGGASLVVDLAADTPVYIKAASNYGEFTFTVTELSDEDKGLSAAAPYVLEQDGQLDVNSGNFYYVFTATADGLITFNFEPIKDTLYFWQYSDADYKKYVSNGRNSLSIEMKEGTTYYIRTSYSGSDEGKFDFNTGAFTNHDYVITVSDGEKTFDGVTVKLFNSGDNVETATPVATGTTANGKVTLSGIDGSKDYKLVLEGASLNGYGYYASDMNIGRNVDQTTNFTATVTAYKTYTVTFKLPEGVEGVDLSGIKVTASNSSTGTFTAVTDAQGVATISALPPYGNGNFIVEVEIPDSLKNSYAYAPARSDSGYVIPLTLTDAANSVEANLAAVVTYKLTLTDGENALPAGVTVTVNGVSATTDAEGKVTIVTAAGVHSITVGGNWITSTTTTAAGGELTVVCTAVLKGSSSPANAPELPMGSTAYIGATRGETYCQFVASEAGTYTISYEETRFDGGVGSVTLNNKLIADMSNDNLLEGELQGNIGMWYIYSFTIELSANDVLLLGIGGNYGSGTITVEKA